MCAANQFRCNIGLCFFSGEKVCGINALFKGRKKKMLSEQKKKKIADWVRVRTSPK